MENKETFTVSRKHSDNEPCCSVGLEERNYDNTNENMSSLSCSSLNDGGDCEITCLPTLHIEHNSNAIFKLVLYYAMTWFVILFGISVVIAFVVKGFFIFVSYKKKGLEAFFAIMVCICIFFVVLITIVLAKSTAYFKRRFLKGELEAFCEIDNLQVNEDYFSFTSRMMNEISKVKKDYFLSKASSLVNGLGIGGCLWNKGEISDDITGNYLGMPFRFFDIKLLKETRKGKSTYIDNVFGGQIFVFKTNLNIQKSIQYSYYTGSCCKNRSDFEKSFAASYYSSQTNPFETTPSAGREKMAIKNVQNEVKNDDFVALETPDFVDNMLRLGLRLTNNFWGVRFVDDYFVLVISRYLNVFELNRFSPRRSLANLDKDIQEFVDILSTVSQMGFIKKA